MQATAATIAAPTSRPAGAPTDFAWTNENIERLKEMWAAGKSANAIAAELGTGSRNSVLGKIHRMGLSGRASIKTGPRPATGAPSPMRKTEPAQPPAPPAPPRLAPAPTPAPQPIAEPPPGGVAFMATRRFHCRYAIAGNGMDMTCCGARTVQGSYCERHAGLIYAGRQTKEEARIEAEMQRRGG